VLHILHTVNILYILTRFDPKYVNSLSYKTHIFMTMELETQSVQRFTHS